MNKQKAKALLSRYREGTASTKERNMLEYWYAKKSFDRMSVPEVEDYERIKTDIWSALLANQDKAVVKVKLWPQLSPMSLRHTAAVAAIFLLVVAAGLYFYGHQPIISQAYVGKDIAPGGNKATLTLANGKRINLSDAKTGIVIDVDKFIYNDGTEVSTQPIKSGHPGSMSGTLSIQTPNGGQYQITLSDGTKVWLNAASSLTYPGRFEGKERRVRITGEAYFEVAHKKSKPFRVESRGQVIEVLGTHFNVAAYTDEALTKTTLLQGKVKVSNQQIAGRIETILKPGQQLQLSSTTNNIISDPDLEEITAWKDGYFKFSESLESIMTKVARWYDIQVIYEDNFDGKLKFVGKISKSKNLSSILDIIESAGNVHFKVEGRRVTVMN